MKQALSATGDDPFLADDPSALVVVVNRPEDLQRALEAGWYRIPLNRAPSRVAAEYLAFYQTGAFPPGERFLVRWMAPVRGYFLATRRELVPEEPHHSRANDQYYKVLLGDPIPLPHSIPSRRLRRITFIPTSLSRLQRAEEINDLWIRSTTQELLWEAMKQAGLDGESQYLIQDDFPECVADFALFCRDGQVAVMIIEPQGSLGHVSESRAIVAGYLANARKWRLFISEGSAIERDPRGCVRRLSELLVELGGLVNPPNT